MDVVASTERTALLTRRHSMVDTTELDDDEDRMKSESSGPVAGGTVLGVHNLAIVFPQFVVGPNSKDRHEKRRSDGGTRLREAMLLSSFCSSLPSEADHLPLFLH